MDSPWMNHWYCSICAQMAYINIYLICSSKKVKPLLAALFIICYIAIGSDLDFEFLIFKIMKINWFYPEQASLWMMEISTNVKVKDTKKKILTNTIILWNIHDEENTMYCNLSVPVSRDQVRTLQQLNRHVNFKISDHTWNVVMSVTTKIK